MHKMRAMTLINSNSVILHPYNRKQSAGFPAVVFSLFATWFWKGKKLVRAQVSKLIIAGEMVIIFKRMGKSFRFFVDINIEFIRKIRSW
jgi:hypothetical protein